VRWSESLETLHGLAPGTFGGTFDDFLRHIDPDEVDRVSGVLRELLTNGDEYVVIYRARSAGGEPLWIEGHGRVFRDLEGEPVKVVGVALDVTEREINSQRVRRLQELASALNDATSGLAVVDTVTGVLAESGFGVELHEVGSALPAPGARAVRHRTDDFVLDLHPPEELQAGAGVPGAAEHVATVADLAVSALRRASRFDEERDTATVLQRILLPAQLRSPPGWTVAAGYAPTSSDNRLGGDFYDVIIVGERLVAFIGDVAGHGLAATAQMSAMRNLLRTLAIQHGGDPAEMLAHAAVLTPDVLDDPDAFVTAGVASLDTATGRLAWSSAGHPAAVVHTGSDATPIECTTGAPLGTPFAADGGVAVATGTRLGPGDVLVLFTDGVVERRDEPLDVSLAAFADRLRSLGDPSPAAVLALTDDPALNTDDRAVLCVRRH
jgi:PAS domain-containing protein